MNTFLFPVVSPNEISNTPTLHHSNENIKETTPQSSRGRWLTAPSHTTGHAGPHPAVHQGKHSS
jgi:hypothetical protein